MILDYEILKFIWWILVGALLIGFAVMDGHDLGVNNLLPFLGKTDTERRVIINAVGPHWDGNQVWFITAGGAVFAAWPFVYAAAFSGLYIGLLLVLFALFFRPLGFDYRNKLEDKRWRAMWDWGIFVSGFVPSLVFGVAFGNLLQGLPFHIDNMFMPHYDKAFIWAFFGLLNPFALLCGVLSVAMITLQGAMWLQVRTEGNVAERARKTALCLAPLVIVLFAAGGFWVAYGIEGFRIVSQPDYNANPNPLAKVVEMETGAWMDIYAAYPVAVLAPVFGFAGAALAWILSMLRRPGFGMLANSLSLAGIIGTAGLSMFPFVMPSSTNPNSGLTLWDATSSHLTLMIMLGAVIIFLPLVLLYTSWAYAKMWGPVNPENIEKNTHSVY
ncbi:MAG: cytochrome d ubiquinol oxidase subunit II [Micavibrio aeruginosavorus]|uniref:Cytochrome d ubiquinol oxidase subunit II n=1 Tax=Micavibrio aeruginosavorus TaxID=349221 RepID=A0A2W4ZV38_9BACT|nr:MAG: cytochrome d ubiquinol oxidase subunit II [Micavibrio aeruginosavorus]